MTDKLLIWPEEVCKMFSEKTRNKSRQGKNNINNSKRDVDRRSCETCKKKGLKKKYQIKLIMLDCIRKFFPVELVGLKGRSRADSVDKKNSKIQFKWKFKFSKVEQLGTKSIKSQDQFKKQLVNNEYQTLYDFKEMIVSKFKITGFNQMRRCESEDGAYEY